MKKNKSLILTAAIYAILFLLYNLIVFVLFDVRTNVFWVSYVFMVIAFLMQMVSLRLSFKNTDVETIFFGIPLVTLSVYYILAELFCSLVFMVFQGAGLKAAITIQLLLLGAYLIIAIIALMSRDAVQDMSGHIKEKVTFHKTILADVEILQGRCEDPELKADLGKLAETVRYSDPMTNPSIEDVEFRIMKKMSELRVYCDHMQISDARKTCSELELLFMERNKKLYISK